MQSGRMKPRTTLPPELCTGPFTTRAAAECGVGQGRLRGADLERPFRGIRSAQQLDTPRQRARALQLRMPAAAFFCGITAAMLTTIPLPPRAERPRELHVAMPAPMRACRTTDVVGHKLHVADCDLTCRDGLRMTTPARTWCDLAAALDLEDLVAAGDFIIHHRHPLASRDNLRAAVARHVGRRGRARLLEALELLDDHSDSRPESIVRVAVVRAGIPGLCANYEIRDAHGVMIARADLCFPEHRVIFEYQGDYHRAEPERWRKDRTRVARLAAAGWHVIEIAADELTDRRMLLRLIRDTLALYPALPRP